MANTFDLGGGVLKNTQLDPDTVSGFPTPDTLLVAGAGANSVQPSFGGNSASAEYSAILGGALAAADRYGMQAYSAGSFSGFSVMQSVSFLLRNTSINTTATTLFLDGSSARLTIPDWRILCATATIMGVRTAGVGVSFGGHIAHFVRKFAVKNINNTVSLVGAVSTLGTDVKTDSFYGVTIAADDVNKSVNIVVTGGAVSNDIWLARVDGVELGRAW
ncbi:hypothetical protein EBZ39_05930 [bacterium]|nr:hypothetical protein [bacterium]